MRLAYIKALPSEQELEASGEEHAGEFLNALSEQGDDEEMEFLKRRSRECDEPLDQPIVWKVRAHG